MSRSRSRLIRPCLLLLAAVASLAFATPAGAAGSAGDKVWSPRAAYILTTSSTLDAVADKLDLSPAQLKALRDLGWQVYWEQRRLQRRSDLVVMNGALSDAEKREILADTGYNESLQSVEESGVAAMEKAVGVSAEELETAMQEVWEADAAEHKLQSQLGVLGLNSATQVGAFRVYGTWFETDEGIALPDRYLKFATLGWQNSGSTARPSGYPNGTYAVNLYWDGTFRSISGATRTSVTPKPAKTITNVPILDVGPWNHDDNWWNSYTDPVRPRRINSAGWDTVGGWRTPSGPGNLIGKPQLGYGVPEAQAAYFNYYGRPARIPTGGDNLFEWSAPAGAGGQWSGADQFGRQVLNPAGVDLGRVPARQLGMENNEWIEVTPLWEARLGLVGPIKMTPGPYIKGQDVHFTYTVKNLGSLTGRWNSFTMTLKSPTGQFVNPPYQGPLTLSPGGQKTFTFKVRLTGTGTWSAFPQAHRAGSWAHIDDDTVTLANILDRRVTRAGGATRWETAVAISKEAWPTTAKAVVVATGLDFPDALSGAALAHAEQGPLLLVGTTVPSAVSAEIARLQPQKIVILGSENVVSTSVASQLQAAAPTASLSRIGGWNRYATSRLIAQAVASHFSGTIPNGTAIVATGRDFPDALAASVMSADKHWPILLTEPSKLPTDTTAAIGTLGITKTIVLGSDRVVSNGVYSALPSPTRLAGATRYDTAAMIADLAESNGLSYHYVGLASGTSFPDALAGGVLAARGWGTMLLTPPDQLAKPTKYRLQRHRTVTTHLQAYGSTNALPSATLSAAEEALR